VAYLWSLARAFLHAGTEGNRSAEGRYRLGRRIRVSIAARTWRGRAEAWGQLTLRTCIVKYPGIKDVGDPWKMVAPVRAECGHNEELNDEMLLQNSESISREWRIWFHKTGSRLSWLMWWEVLELRTQDSSAPIICQP
jgi:hypothetical protein